MSGERCGRCGHDRTEHSYGCGACHYVEPCLCPAFHDDQGGTVAAAVDQATRPDSPDEDLVRELQRCIRAVKKHANKYGIDCTAIFLCDQAQLAAERIGEQAEDLRHEQIGAEELFAAAEFKDGECRTHDTLCIRIQHIRKQLDRAERERDRLKARWDACDCRSDPCHACRLAATEQDDE